MSLSSRVGDLASRLALEMKYLKDNVDFNYRHYPYVNIDANFPTIDLSAQGSRLAISRTGNVVELLIAAARFADRTAFTGAIPAGFRPTSYMYGVMTGNASTEPRASHFYEVDIRSNGNFTIHGTSPAEMVRGKFTWITIDDFPPGYGYSLYGHAPYGHGSEYKGW